MLSGGTLLVDFLSDSIFGVQHALLYNYPFHSLATLQCVSDRVHQTFQVNSQLKKNSLLFFKIAPSTIFAKFCLNCVDVKE